jgi:THO complex subunit 4
MTLTRTPFPTRFTNTHSQEYFNETVGHVRRVEVEYNRDGSSKGKAEILFNTAKGADICFEKLNGLPIDGRPIRVEIISAQPNRDAPKSISERAGQPKKEKVQPKSAVDNKKDQQKNPRGANQQNKNGVRKPQAAQNKPAQRPRNARPAKKTLEELDLEMADYFEGAPGDAPAAENGGDAAAPAAAAGGDDAAMDDEIS